MSVLDLLTRTVTIVHRSASDTTDEYGHQATTQTSTSTVGELQQTRRDEQALQGEISTTTWLLILPPDTVLNTGDVVTVDDDNYEVVGDPWAARNPRTGVTHHVEATLVRVAGSDDA